MSAPYPPKGLPPSEFSEEPPPPYTDEPPMDTTPQVEMNQEIHLAVETSELNVESPMRKICKMMCVTTNGALMVIAWTMVSMYFSTLSEYWLLATLPVYHYYDFLIAYIYPASAVMVVVLLLSPVFAVAGDVRYGNFRLLVLGVIPLNVFGLIVLVVVVGLVAATIVGKAFISYFLLIGYLLVLLAGGIFQANAIQFGRDVLGDWNSPERSAFVHWYYWATYVPTCTFAVVVFWFAIDQIIVFVILAYVVPIAIIAVLIFLLVTCVVNCVHMKSRGQNTVLPRLTGNPVKQVFRVTRYALQGPVHPGHRGLLARLNKSRMRNGGPADDDEVDNVASFWLLVLLMVSLYGFFFWDDMWVMPFANTVIEDSSSILRALSSQATTSVVVFISVPIYQLVIRPLMRCSPPLLWRILAGLILLLISLAVVTWNGAATTAQFGSEELSDVCNFNLTNDVFGNGTQAGEGVGWFVLAIPQGINGISQLLVFPAVIELILTDAPRVMQGLLIGVWYAMQSIHVLVRIIETATCAVYYWQYYILKIVLVLMSTISFGIIAFFYRRNRAVLISRALQAQREVSAYQRLQEVSNVDNI